MVIAAIKLSCHCRVIIVFDVKYMTLESIYDSVFCPTYLVWNQLHSKQAIYKFITLAHAFSDCFVGFIVV